MSTEAAITQSTEAEFDNLKQDIAKIILADESPVAEDAAFKKDRKIYSDLIGQLTQIQKNVELLKSANSELGKAELVVKKAGVEFHAQKKQLLELAGNLGKAVFDGRKSGHISDSAFFKNRMDLELRIDELKKQINLLSLESPTGVLEQASNKAQQIKLASQIKLEEFKIESANKALGKEILTANADDEVKCDSTENILGIIANQRLRVTKATEAVKTAEDNFFAAKKMAADKIGCGEVKEPALLRSQQIEQQKKFNSIEAEIKDLQESIVEKALSYEWLRENPILGEPLERLEKLKHQVTPRKLSIWPLVTVVIIGHLCQSFGKEPVNLSAFNVLVLYIGTALGGLALLAYYKPDLASGDRRYTSMMLLFSYSVIGIIGLFAFQNLTEYAVSNWSQKSLRGFDPRKFLVLIGQAYRDTFSIMFGTGKPASFLKYFETHMLSVGLCEELIKLAPAIVAFTAFTGNWSSRSSDFNSKLVYLAMIGGLAFGLGEAVHYHTEYYAPLKVAWGIYATRFLSLVLIHAVWAGISGWILAHVTGGWIRSLLKSGTGGWGLIILVFALFALTIGISDFLHTCHNLSANQIWVLAWDIVSIAIFAWLVRCSSLSQLRTPNLLAFSFKHVTSANSYRNADSNNHAFSKKNESSDNPAPDINSSDGQINNQKTESSLAEIKLWNPNAAGLWSFLLSPIFGAWLHALNWKSLGQPDKAKICFYWVYSSIAFEFARYFLPDIVAYIGFVVLLVAWWLQSGKEQYKYVKENVPNYQKKKWATPLSIAGLIFLGLLFLTYALGEDTMASQQN